MPILPRVRGVRSSECRRYLRRESCEERRPVQPTLYCSLFFGTSHESSKRGVYNWHALQSNPEGPQGRLQVLPTGHTLSFLPFQFHEIVWIASAVLDTRLILRNSKSEENHGPRRVGERYCCRERGLKESSRKALLLSISAVHESTTSRAHLREIQLKSINLAHTPVPFSAAAPRSILAGATQCTFTLGTYSTEARAVTSRVLCERFCSSQGKTREGEEEKGLW